MKFSKYISKAATQVMTLFQKQRSYLSKKATTICGQAAENLRQVSIRHGREGDATKIKVQFVPPTMCRQTMYRLLLKHFPYNFISLNSILYIPFTTTI